MIEKFFSELRICKLVILDKSVQYINTHDQLQVLPFKIQSLALYRRHSVSHFFYVDI